MKKLAPFLVGDSTMSDEMQMQDEYKSYLDACDDTPVSFQDYDKIRYTSDWIEVMQTSEMAKADVLLRAPLLAWKEYLGTPDQTESTEAHKKLKERLKKITSKKYLQFQKIIRAMDKTSKLISNDQQEITTLPNALSDKDFNELKREQGELTTRLEKAQATRKRHVVLRNQLRGNEKTMKKYNGWYGKTLERVKEDLDLPSLDRRRLASSPEIELVPPMGIWLCFFALLALIIVFFYRRFTKSAKRKPLLPIWNDEAEKTDFSKLT